MHGFLNLMLACLLLINVLQTTLGDFLQDGRHHFLSREVLKVKVDGSDEFDMSYMKCTSKGCELVKGSVKELPKQGPWEVETVGSHSRSKRRMFLPDNRLRVRANSVGRFPFNSAVAIRVNGTVKCSGVALRSRFFLTAAHCIHPGRRWQDGRPDLEVGVLYKYGTMQWAKVNNTRVPLVWKKRKPTRRMLRLKDYAVLESEEPLRVTAMPFAYIGENHRGVESLEVNKTYMYFNAFDDSRRPENLNMRFCKMKKINYRRIYNKCDTVPATAGAGVYVRMRNKETGKVERKVIAIATGDYGVREDQEYSVALRINSRMFPHICRMVTGSFNKC